ncbi:MAG: replication initiation protein, partial [Fusobacteriaceae bacterium]|nr:replication initiation protein [Fusobacteriaceae bacterium]
MINYQGIFYKNNEITDISVNFSRKINLKERIFFEYLLEITKNKFQKIEISKSFFYKNINLTCKDEIFIFLDKILEIKYLIKIPSLSFQGGFLLISSYFIDNANVTITLTEEVLKSLEINSFYYILEPLNVINFRNQYSLKIFEEILKIFDFTKEEGEIYYTYEDFKIILGLKELYNRPYDFDRKVIKKILDDFIFSKNLKLNIEKIKKTDKTNSKILNIKIKIHSMKYDEIKKQVNTLIGFAQNKINNFEEVYNLILKNLLKDGYTETYKHIKYAIINNKANKFDKVLEKSFNSSTNKNLSSTETSKKILSFNNLYEVITELLNELKLGELSGDNDFFSQFYRKFFI